MAASMLDRVREAAVLEPGERVLGLVSGGRDSTCLLDILVAILGASRVTALHVNYGLRGEESEGDETHVRALCQALGVGLVVHRAPAPPGRGNLQAWARDVRYARAIEHAPAGAAIATGHTRSDLAETIVYRLAASPGRRALVGMRVREGRLLRPLLSLTREETAEHCRSRELAWREDSSNASDRFARARLRRDAMPALRAIQRHAERNIAATAEILRAEGEVLDEVVATALAGRDRISLERLAELPPALGRLLLIRLAEDAAGGAPLPGIGGRLPEILALARSGGSATLDAGRGVQAIVEYGVLRFAGRSAPPDRAAEHPLAIPGTVSFGGWALTAALGSTGEPSGGDCDTAVLDADALARLTVRAWRPGDRMHPAGRTSTRALSDLFTARRIPRAQRAAMPLLCSGGEIAWVPGVASAAAFQPHTATVRFAVLAARRP